LFAELKRYVANLHEALKFFVEESGGEKLSFIGTLVEDDGVQKFVSSIRQALRITENEQRSIRSESDMLGFLQERPRTLEFMFYFRGIWEVITRKYPEMSFRVWQLQIILPL